MNAPAPAPEKPRYAWYEMYNRALRVYDLLRPYCVRLHIAGSLRRGSDTVGDIELVAISKGAALHQFCDTLEASGVFVKRRKSNGALLAWGDRYKAFAHEDVPVDLFVTTEYQFGLIYLIRTGPGKGSGAWKGGANQVLVTNRRAGGLLPDDIQMRDGWLWRGDKALRTSEEPDVYRLLGIPYIAPYNRTVDEYLRRRREGAQGVEKLWQQQWSIMARADFYPSVGYRYTPGVVFRIGYDGCPHPLHPDWRKHADQS